MASHFHLVELLIPLFPLFLMSVDYLALGTLNLFCWGFFSVVGGSGLIGVFFGQGTRWGCGFLFVCLCFLL